MGGEVMEEVKTLLAEDERIVAEDTKTAFQNR